MPKLAKCPKCGYDVIKILPNILINYKCELNFMDKKINAICMGNCDQKFWYYPKTGKITRRNK